MKKELLIIIVVIALIAVGSILFIEKFTSKGLTGYSVFQNSPTKYCDKTVPKTISERVCETIPYECNKPCTEEKVVIENVPLKYTVVDEKKVSYGIFRVSYKTQVSIRNDDNVGGIFKVRYDITKSNGGTITETTEKFIKPYETIIIATGYHEFSISGWTYKITPPMKEKPVTKSVTSTCKEVCYKEDCSYKERVKYVTERIVC